MTPEFVNGDVKIINILVYNGMVNVSVVIHLVGFSNTTIKDILKTREERKEMYGGDNHFQEELIGGGRIMVVVEIVYLLDQKQMGMYWPIINMAGLILNPKMVHTDLNHGLNVRMKVELVEHRDWLDMERVIDGYIGQEEMGQH